MNTLYNEINAYPSQWLRNLIAAGHIAPGNVIERSIADLQPEDVRHATQAHFFAGIGVWSAALRDAGWPDDRPVWTGSCPCQPFSDAGRGRGVADDRHLWPEWFRLIRECRPPVIFAEQVASRAGLDWLDVVFADLEGEGYACAAADLPAAGVGAPHKRSRLFFVAYANGEQRRLHETGREPGRADAQAGGRGEAQRVADRDAGRRRAHEPMPQPGADESHAARSGHAGRVADANRHDGSRRIAQPHGWSPIEPDRYGSAGELADVPRNGRHEGRADRSGRGDRAQPDDQRDRPAYDSASRNVVDASSARSGRDAGAVSGAQEEGDREWLDARRLVDVPRSAGATRGYWAGADWLLCRDGKARPVEPGTFPLVDGTPRGVVRNRAAKLKGYGNAIVRQAAAAFIRAAMKAAP